METTTSAPPVTIKKRRPLIIAGVVVISIFSIGILAVAGYMFTFKDRIFPGVTVNGLRLGGLTKEEASAKLNASVTIYENDGLNFEYKGKNTTIEATQLPDGDVDAARQLLNIDDEKGLAMAFSVGRAPDLVDCIKQAAIALRYGAKVTLAYKLDDLGFKNALRKFWSVDEKTVKDAKLVIIMNGNSLSRVSTTKDESGFEFDYDRAISDLKDKISRLDQSPIELHPARTTPNIFEADAKAVATLVPNALNLAPLPMKAGEIEWVMEARDLAKLLQVAKDGNNRPILSIDTDAATKYFKRLALDYDIKPSNTRYEIDPTTQKMALFEAGRNGRRIDIEKSITALQIALLKQLSGADGKTDFNIVASADNSQVVTSSAADLGIKEVIGVGQSDFTGSSGNRIKNITHGSSKLNGILIAPEQEFSALAALEPVTIEDGYFAEQIILGDKIEPGVGGGLCQIGTTLFRMAMNTGLPITERQNHSLVVHYYSDPTNGNPGTDATLYGPHPDLRFLNNTGHWMLLTTEINVKTKKLTYTLWGTSDGRHGSYTPPKVNEWIAAPAEVKNIEDPTLEPGTQKCQSAFRGAKTSFLYTIVNPDGTITEKTFNSYYRPLPKICTNGPTAAPAEIPKSNNQIPNNTNTNAPLNNIDLPPEAIVGN